MAKKKGHQQVGRGSSGAQGGAGYQTWIIAGLVAAVGIGFVWKSQKKPKAPVYQAEPPLQPQRLMQSMKLVQELKPISMEDAAQQVRFFCGAQADATELGPHTEAMPDDTCWTYIKGLDRVSKALEARKQTGSESIDFAVGTNLGKRLAALTVRRMDFDALQGLVLTLADQLDRRKPEPNDLRWAAAWHPGMVPLLVSHLIHGDEAYRWEKRLRRLRWALFKEVPKPDSGLDLSVVAAIACQTALSEFSWYEAPYETKAIDDALKILGTSPNPNDDRVRLTVAALAMYKPLLELVERWTSLATWRDTFQRERQVSSTWAFWALWKANVEDRLIERSLWSTFGRGGGAPSFDDHTSREVSAMYESNPYPRWSWMTPDTGWPETLGGWFLEKNWDPPSANWPASFEHNPKVLISGCGTGRWLTHFARHYPGADIWAVDLSRTSLSFAARKGQEVGLKNVKYRHGDILDAPAEIREAGPFEFIEAGGMLHHLREPMNGWKALVSLLRPGGVMLVALYSKIARSTNVDPCRRMSKAYDAQNISSLRQYRKDVSDLIEKGKEQWAVDLSGSSDFVSLSGLRDLCFHIQETQYTMLEIEKMLEELGLEWLQMAETVSEEKQKIFERRNGFKPFSKQATPKVWHAFEEKYPTTFLGMFEFWTRLPQKS